MLSRFPRALANNSTIGLICPAGGFEDYKPIVLASRYLKKHGYKVKLGDSLVNSKKSYKYLSGSDEERLGDLLGFWFDKDVDAIFCLKGGYGSLRLLNKINFNKIKDIKKIFLGFSDITVLLTALYAKTNMITFHSPMLGADFLHRNLSPKDKISAKYMFNMLRDPSLKFSYSSKDEGVTINPGKTSGYLLGGNLTSLCSMIGTGYLPDFRDSILFLEDVNEEPYTVDRMITQLAMTGIFNRVTGVIFTSFNNSGFRSRGQVSALIRDKLAKYKFPVIYYFPSGHGAKNYILPIGRRVLFDADNRSLSSC